MGSSPRASFVVAILVGLAACTRPGGTLPVEPPRIEPPRIEPRQVDRVTWQRAEVPAGIPREPPAAGTYRIHMIDVGTGLALLIQGADFAMLYDAGSNDREEKPARVLAYLAAALGPSGEGPLCGDPPAGSQRTIDQIVLSHPHFDHASALDTVLHCYDVRQFWESGAINEAVFYRELMAAVAREPELVYRTAGEVPADHRRTVKDVTVEIPRWQRYAEGDRVALGDGARFTILAADPKATRDLNASSLVVLVELGHTRLLLVGDAPSGARLDPSAAPGAVEAYLLDHHAADIRADIFQVGHHGSKTSSRRAFLEAISPTLALVSSGPKVYGSVVLPDREVLDELARLHVTVLRTDERDASCPVAGRVGGDTGPGGCDGWIVTIAP